MDIKGKGLEVKVNPSEQSDEWLIESAKEITAASTQRGLNMAFVTGTVALEGAMQEIGKEPEVSTLDTKEFVAEQLPIALLGYRTTIDALNDRRWRFMKIRPVATDETFTAEFKSWFNSDKLAAVAAAREANPEVHFTLVATPNIYVGYRSLIKIAQAFSQHPSEKVCVWDGLYASYMPEQLSGTNPNNGNCVQFSLIPSNFRPEMTGSIKKQRTVLTRLKIANPDLKIPSPLESVTYWYTLRAQGLQLDDNTTYDLTFIRHIDLPLRARRGWRCVPSSYIFKDNSYAGKVHERLSSSGILSDEPVRISLG